MCGSVKSRVGLPVPHHIIDGFNDRAIEPLPVGFADPEEVCRECVLNCGINLLTNDRKELVGVVVDYFGHGY